jgi:ADP-heptose:LPS heptosyltransferase
VNNQLAATANHIARMDLVIGVHTSVAHLTGATDKPICLMKKTNYFDGRGMA